jgi:hypothetical protein
MRIAAIVMSLVLAGCSTQQLVDKRVSQLPPGTPEIYKTGYADGCFTVAKETCSASGQGAPRRDSNLMKADKDYSTGWNDGVRGCSCAGTAYSYIPLTSD